MVKPCKPPCLMLKTTIFDGQEPPHWSPKWHLQVHDWYWGRKQVPCVSTATWREIKGKKRPVGTNGVGGGILPFTNHIYIYIIITIIIIINIIIIVNIILYKTYIV